MDLVTPCNVKSPVRTKFSPLGLTEVEVNVAVGNFSTSKKSAVLRWPSRCSLSVVMDATSISALSYSMTSSVSFSVTGPITSWISGYSDSVSSRTTRETL